MGNAAVFFDRDGTLIEDPGYLNHPDQVRLLDGTAEVLKQLRGLGYKIVVVTNQSGVARGIVSEDMLGRIHKRLEELLAQKGASLDNIYYCPYHPEGVIPKYKQDSDWRKPQPGMLLAAAAEMDIDLTQSWVVGDSRRDIEAGRAVHCRTILLRSGPTNQETDGDDGPDYVAVNLREAAHMIKKFHRTPQGESVPLYPAVDADEISEQELSVTQREAEELRIEPAEEEPAPAIEEPRRPSTEEPQLLREILDQLRQMQKHEMFGEFSVMRLLAGVVQIFVLFCLLLALWFLMTPDRQDNNIFMALGFGTVLQVMALTFYIMQDRR